MLLLFIVVVVVMVALFLIGTYTYSVNDDYSLCMLVVHLLFDHYIHTYHRISVFEYEKTGL